jgi:hypothetical protein
MHSRAICVAVCVRCELHEFVGVGVHCVALHLD